MRLTFRLLPAMLFLSICTYAQNGTGKIKGVVMDDSGDEALTGATLIIEELKIGETAGKDGDFSFSGLKYDMIRFICSSGGDCRERRLRRRFRRA